MAKYTHEIRDPIHAFVRLQGDERNVLDSRPFQRLRNIHQLATTFLVYPSATHKRFEHSLGVMELAGRVYDVITDTENIFHNDVREIIPKVDSDEHRYWRRVLRMAALCHDVGHLPFSHAAESELLPDGKSHEDLTCALIKSDEMTSIWNSIKPPLLPDDIEKLAVGKRHLKNVKFSLWESILSEIIVGDAFGVDRMDYLLRDSLHTGVGYGRFDHFRLIDTLRMLPFSDVPDQGEEPVLGIELGGLHSAEELIMARYFMFS
jgi:HD superfamily phosphohydrolase